MQIFLHFLILFAHYTFAGDNLLLIDEQEISSKVPFSNDWDFVIQNPYEGIVEVLRSPTNKFQVLLNGSFGNEQNLALHYTLRTGSSEMFLKVSTRAFQQRLYTDVEEDTVYLQLLLITVASLVLVVFVVSIIFSCWWIKSRQDNYDIANLNTVFVSRSAPPFPAVHYVDTADQYNFKNDVDSVARPGNGLSQNDGDIKLVTLGRNTGLNSYRPGDANEDLLCGSEYATFTALERENIESNVCDISLPGMTHTQPRYTIAGSGNGGVVGLPSCSTHAILPKDGLGPSLVTGNSSSHQDSTINRHNIEISTIDGTASVRAGSTASVGRTRHVAKEFLDESVLNTATRRKKSRESILSPNAQASLAALSQQPVILVPAPGMAGDANTTYLITSSTGGVMRPMSPIRLVETLEGGTQVTPIINMNPCELHPSTGTQGTLFVHVDTNHPPTISELQRLSPSLHTVTAAVTMPVHPTPMMAGDLLAEMAACPQHSYLLRQQINNTFEASPPLPSVTPHPPATAHDESQKMPGPVEASNSASEISSSAATNSTDPPETSKHSPKPELHSCRVNVPEVETMVTNLPGNSDTFSSDVAASKPLKSGGSETLPRSMGGSRSRETGEEEDTGSQRPGSSATLPAGGARRSALKQDKDKYVGTGPKVSKHIRFTALNLVACSCIVTVAVASQPITYISKDPSFSFATNTLSNWAPAQGVKSVIKFHEGSTEKNAPQRVKKVPQLHITVWLPQHFFPSDKNRPEKNKYIKSQRKAQNDSSSIFKLHQKPPKSIQLWLNKTSKIEVHLGPDISRMALEIFDVANANIIQSTRSCRQRYACEHSCDPGASHACICQRGYRPSGPEDRARHQGYGSNTGSLGLDSIKGRICIDVDECEDPSIRAECTRRGGVCINLPGNYRCRCPSEVTCLRDSVHVFSVTYRDLAKYSKAI